MSKTWYMIKVECLNCGESSLMRVLKNAPPQCPSCKKPMHEKARCEHKDEYFSDNIMRCVMCGRQTER